MYIYYHTSSNAIITIIINVSNNVNLDICVTTQTPN